jgi:stalled ribosome rescue protein Dom34
MNKAGINLQAALIAHVMEDILALKDKDVMEARVKEEVNKFMATDHPALEGASPEEVSAIFRDAFNARLSEVLTAESIRGAKIVNSGDADAMDDFADRMKRMGFYK